MILARRVALNGTQLDSMDNRILISSIDEAAGRDNITAVSRGAGGGQRITNMRRDTLDVTVKFALNIKSSDMAGRTALLNRINKWAAGGGVLTVGHRSGQQLNVVLAQAPGGGDIFSWANEFTLVFRAYGIPFWQETTASGTVTIAAATSGFDSLTVGGSANTVADVILTNQGSATVNNCEITVNGNTMAFSSLGLAVGESLVIDHTGDGLLQILIYETDEYYRSAMGKRTPASADDLWCVPGVCEVSFEADYACKMTVNCKGRFL